jgi:GT2 family glycosyltransferase
MAPSTSWNNSRTAARSITTTRTLGFAAAQNQAIRLAGGDWVLTLNPDVLLLPNFIQALLDAGQFDSKIGAVCGKLLTMSAHFEIPEQPVVDSTGIYFNPMLRHLDRGSQEVDNGHYLHYEYVFGATAAAALYRRAMIDDISLDGEFFDSDFFVYREDADVAWRAQLMGWKCLYVPYTRAAIMCARCCPATGARCRPRSTCTR